ncbi:hypothetical protein TNCV_5094351 [Trichonephila clavipes]|nr:hypothetical protein TNCV_5094351 [Trichonephila clavipes]
MIMTSHNRSDDSLSTRDVGRFEAGQPQAEVARWLQVARNWSRGSLLDIKRTTTRRRTAPQLTHDLAAVLKKNFQADTFYIRLADTDPYARRPIWSVSLTASSRKDRILWS